MDKFENIFLWIITATFGFGFIYFLREAVIDTTLKGMTISFAVVFLLATIFIFYIKGKLNQNKLT